MVQTVQANCVRCHASENATLKMNADKYHSEKEVWWIVVNAGMSQHVPHGKVRSLTSTPFNLGVKENMK